MTLPVYSQPSGLNPKDMKWSKWICYIHKLPSMKVFFKPEISWELFVSEMQTDFGMCKACFESQAVFQLANCKLTWNYYRSYDPKFINEIDWKHRELRPL